MKKSLFILLMFFCMTISVDAKTSLITCYYDQTKIENNQYLKAKVILYSDKSIKWAFKNSSGQYNDGTYGKVQSYDSMDKKISTSYASFSQSNNFYEAYISYSKKCPSIKLTSKTDDNSYQFKAASKTDNEGLISKSTKEETSKTETSTTSDDYTECIKNITSKDLEDVIGTTLYFRKYKSGDKKEFCVRTKNTPKDSTIPCTKITGTSDISLSTIDNKKSYIFTINKEDIDSIWNNSENCPNNIYAGLMDEDSNVLSITITTNKDNIKDALTSAAVGQGESEEKQSTNSLAGFKPSVKVNVNVSEEGCNILGDDLTKWLQWLLDVLRVGGLTLAIILGISDFLKAISVKDYDLMKKANKDFSTRLLSLAFLFLVPTVIDFVLTFLSIGVTGDNPTCGVN